MAGGDQQSCLTIGRKIHVARQKCLAKSTADRLFTHVLHIEGCFALSLRYQHPCVERSQNHHVTQTLEQFFVAQEAAPRTDRLTVAVKNADDRIGGVADRFRIGVPLRPRHRSRSWNPDTRKIGGATRPNRRFGHMEGQRAIISHVVTSPIEALSLPNSLSLS